MIFTNLFLFQCIFTAMVSLIFFFLPGLFVSHLLGLKKQQGGAQVFMFPALGLCSFGPSSRSIFAEIRQIYGP